MSKAINANTKTKTENQVAPFAPGEAHPRSVFETLLTDAIEKPGILSEAYSAFHNYSIGNQLLAASQLIGRGLPIAPIASFNTWREKGRFVKKGEKAIKLFMPVTIKEKDKETKEETGSVFQTFMLRPNWFSLDQTEGAEIDNEAKTAEWNPELALAALGITQTRFELLSGNCQGYATGNEIAINPLAALPHKTRFHELAHIILGHTTEGMMSDDEQTPKNIKEVEAESVAYILVSILGLPGQVESRGYIQNWLAGDKIEEKSARKIFTAADKIMKAGQPVMA